jgi:hypothetical protein
MKVKCCKRKKNTFKIWTTKGVASKICGTNETKKVGWEESKKLREHPKLNSETKEISIKD